MQTVLARLKQKNKLNKKNILPFLEASLLGSGSLPLGETCYPQSGHSQYLGRQGLWFFFVKINMYSTACGLELGVRLNLIFFLHLVTVLWFEALLNFYANKKPFLFNYMSCVSFGRRLHYATGIWQRRLHAENARRGNCYCRKTQWGKVHDYRGAIVYQKLPFENVSRQHENEKPAFPNSSSLKRFFQKLRLFSRLIIVDGRSNRRNKTAFLNSSCTSSDFWKKFFALSDRETEYQELQI